MLLVLYQVQIIMGIFISYVIDLGTHTINGPASWRIPVGLQIAWGFILLSGIFFLPESPRHLLGTGRGAEARAVVAELNSVPENDPIVVDIIEELEFAIHAENDGGKATWIECFSSRNMLWKRTINGMMLQFIQQLNGQNFYCTFILLAFYYSPLTTLPADYYGDTFFKSAGTQLSAYVIQVILGAVSVAGTLPALYLIDTWGRRRVSCHVTCSLLRRLTRDHLVPHDRRRIRGCMCVDCGPRRPLPARTVRHSHRPADEDGEDGRQRPHRVCRVARPWLFSLLGTHTLGVPRRVFPPARPSEVHCARFCNEWVLNCNISGSWC